MPAPPLCKLEHPSTWKAGLENSGGAGAGGAGGNGGGGGGGTERRPRVGMKPGGLGGGGHHAGT